MNEATESFFVSRELVIDNKRFDQVKLTTKDLKMWNEKHLDNKVKENTDSI